MLTEPQIERYARHILLREVGGVGQLRLLAGEVRLEGLGAVAEWTSAYLTLAGVGRIGLRDDGVLREEVSGPMIDAAQRGRPPAQALAEALASFNEEVEIQTAVGSVGASAWAAAWRGVGAMVAHTGAGDLLVAKARGPRAVLAWYDPTAPACVRCAEAFLEADGIEAAATAGFVGSLAAGELLQRLLGIGTQPAGLRLFLACLPKATPSCSCVGASSAG